MTRHRHFFRMLRRISFLHIVPSRTGCFLYRMASHFDSAGLISLLLRRGLLLGSYDAGAKFSNEGCVHVTVHSARSGGCLTRGLGGLRT